MRRVGLLLVTVGFLAATLVAVLDREAIDWRLFVPAYVVGAIGVAVARRGAREAAQAPEVIEASFQTLDETLRRIVERVDALHDDKHDVHIYDLPEAIDERFIDDIEAFVEARHAIAHAWGMQAYADVMSHFAAGERYLNRVWSTAADGWIDEAHAYLEHSHGQFALALERLEAYAEEHAGA
ncbi:MAG: hypothetical protein ACQEXJ_10305 [Myxococcota bacterium]